MSNTNIIKVLKETANNLRKQAESVNDNNQKQKSMVKLSSTHVKNFLNFYGRLV